MHDWFSIPELAEDYDIVIVDNPPSKSPVSAGMLGAATHVIIPTEPEYDSIDGVPMLLNRVDRINEDRQRAPLKIVGVVPNKVPSKSRLTQKDEVALAKLYDKNGPTGKYMTRFGFSNVIAIALWNAHLLMSHILITCIIITRKKKCRSFMN